MQTNISTSMRRPYLHAKSKSYTVVIFRYTILKNYLDQNGSRLVKLSSQYVWSIANMSPNFFHDQGSLRNLILKKKINHSKQEKRIVHYWVGNGL